MKIQNRFLCLHSLSVLILVQFACAVQSSAAVQSGSIGVHWTISPTATPSIVTITYANVNIRDDYYHITGKIAHAGESYAGACGPEWCAIAVDTMSGYVWRGCTDQATKGQGCK